MVTHRGPFEDGPAKGNKKIVWTKKRPFHMRIGEHKTFVSGRHRERLNGTTQGIISLVGIKNLVPKKVEISFKNWRSKQILMEMIKREIDS